MGLTRVDAILIFFSIVIFVGAVIPALISPFQDITNPNLNSAVYGTVDFFTSKYNLLYLGFSWVVPDAIDNYYKSMWYSFTYLPDYISIPLLLILAVLGAVVVFFAAGGS